MDKKYELTEPSIEYFGRRLFRIRAIRDFGDVQKGELGGFVESEKNLSHEGNCWIYDNSIVCDNGKVSGNGKVFWHSVVCDNGRVCDNGKLCGNGKVFDGGKVKDNGIVLGHGKVSGHGLVCGNGRVLDFGVVSDNGVVKDNGGVAGYGTISDNGVVSGNVEICGETVIRGTAIVRQLDDYIVFKNNWSSGRYFTWTKSNNMWTAGCFYGTGEELIERAYKDSEESGKKYESYVRLVEENFL